MKRRIIVILFISAVLLFAGCKQSNTDGESTDSSTEEDYEEYDEDTAYEQEEEEVVQSNVSVPDITEREILNQDGIIITMKNFEKGSRSLDLKVLIENTTNKQIEVNLQSLVVNGYSMQDAYITGTIEGNAKLNTEMSIDLVEINRCNIEEIIDFEMVFLITDCENWDTISTSDVIKVTTGSTFVQEYDDTGTILVDEKGIKIVFKELIEADEFSDPYIILYTENNTEKAVELVCENVEVDESSVTGVLYTVVEPGTRSIVTLEFVTQNTVSDFDELKIAFQANYFDEQEYLLETDLVDIPIE